MIYLKVAVDGTVIGAATENDCQRWQEKHSQLLWCDINSAEYIYIDGTLYHDTWLCPITSTEPDYIDATITAIEEEEYEELAAALELGEAILAETAEETEESENTENTEEDTGNDDALSTAAKYSARLTLVEEALVELAELVAELAEGI